MFALCPANLRVVLNSVQGHSPRLNGSAEDEEVSRVWPKIGIIIIVLFCVVLFQHVNIVSWVKAARAAADYTRSDLPYKAPFCD